MSRAADKPSATPKPITTGQTTARTPLPPTSAYFDLNAQGGMWRRSGDALDVTMTAPSLQMPSGLTVTCTTNNTQSQYGNVAQLLQQNANR